MTKPESATQHQARGRKKKKKKKKKKTKKTNPPLLPRATQKTTHTLTVTTPLKHCHKKKTTQLILTSITSQKATRKLSILELGVAELADSGLRSMKNTLFMELMVHTILLL